MPSWTAKSPSVFYFVFIVLFNYENYERKKKKQFEDYLNRMYKNLTNKEL